MKGRPADREKGEGGEEERGGNGDGNQIPWMCNYVKRNPDTTYKYNALIKVIF